MFRRRGSFRGRRRTFRRGGFRRVRSFRSRAFRPGRVGWRL